MILEWVADHFDMVAFVAGTCVLAALIWIYQMYEGDE